MDEEPSWLWVELRNGGYFRARPTLLPFFTLTGRRSKSVIKKSHTSHSIVTVLHRVMKLLMGDAYKTRSTWPVDLGNPIVATTYFNSRMSAGFSINWTRHTTLFTAQNHIELTQRDVPRSYTLAINLKLSPSSVHITYRVSTAISGAILDRCTPLFTDCVSSLQSGV